MSRDDTPREPPRHAGMLPPHDIEAEADLLGRRPADIDADSEPDNEMAAELVGIEGGTSMFATADFITLSKRPDASWEPIAALAQSILERYFD